LFAHYAEKLSYLEIVDHEFLKTIAEGGKNKK
jgi:hypothetical protein